MLELNVEYTYKDICDALGWTYQTSNNPYKRKQIACIEESFKYYHPLNKKTKKPKKSYVLTEQIKEPILVDGRKDNGGTREGAGRKPVLEDEFLYVFSAFAWMESSRNNRCALSNLCITFSKSHITRYFGIMPRTFYDAKEDQNIDKDVFDAVNGKLLSIRNTLILNKIPRVDGLNVHKGVVVQKKNNHLEFPNSLLDEFITIRNDWLMENNTTVYKAYLDGNGFEMGEYIAGEEPFDKFKADRVYEGVCVTSGRENGLLDRFDFATLNKYRRMFYDRAMNQVISWAEKKRMNMRQVRYLLNKYAAFDEDFEH